MPDAFTVVHRVPIVSAAARSNVPTVYSLSVFACTAVCSHTDQTR
jgi:hypothetical protein